MKQKIFLGTYTKRESKGVYSIILDTDTQKFEDLTLIAEAGSPTYLDVSADGSVMYAVSKEDSGHGGIASFKKDTSNHFQPSDTVLAEGAPPCYVAHDEKRSFVYTANYHKGEAAVYQADADGHLTLRDTVAHSGSSVHENQQSPHAHYFDLTPDGKFLIACDLGTDEVFTYETTDEGNIREVNRVDMEPGTGPRHIVFHPNGKYAYVFGELSSDVIAMAYEEETGTLKPFQRIPSIPETHTEFNSGAAIRISPDGRFLYASNRGHNSLVTYKVDPADGTLELLGWTSTEGDFPRDFNLDPSGKFIVVGHQESDNLVLFERDEETGQLTLLEKDVYAPEVVCVKFV